MSNHLLSCMYNITQKQDFVFLLQGWSSAYTVEAVIMQIAATLVKGKARINFQENKKVGCWFLANEFTTR